jgi:hypothetical protein
LGDLSLELFEEHQLLPDKYQRHIIKLAQICRSTASYEFHSDWLFKLYDTIIQWIIEHRELYGEFSCTINEHKLMHLPWNILQFSTTAIYRCFGFERKVGTLFKNISTDSNHANEEVFK